MNTTDTDSVTNVKESPKRRQIRKGATTLFLERGFTRSSADAIASTAGVSKATLYAHYDDKDAILTDVVRHLVDDMFAVDLASSPDDVDVTDFDDLRSQLTRLHHAVVTAALDPDHLRLLRIVISESPHHESITATFRRLAPGRALVAVRVTLEAARRSGMLESVDLDVLARLVVGDMISWIILDGLLATGDPKPPSRRRVAQSIDMLLDGRH